MTRVLEGCVPLLLHHLFNIYIRHSLLKRCKGFLQHPGRMDQQRSGPYKESGQNPLRGCRKEKNRQPEKNEHSTREVNPAFAEVPYAG